MEKRWYSCSESFCAKLRTKFGLSTFPSLHFCCLFIIPALHFSSVRSLLFLLLSPFSTLSLSSSSPHVSPLKLSVSPSHASLCVLFLAERCLVQPSVSYFPLFLSLSLSCRPCQSHPSEELFSASPFKILETLWSRMALCRRVRRRLCLRLCVQVSCVFGLLDGGGEGGSDVGRWDRTSSSK